MIESGCSLSSNEFTSKLTAWCMLRMMRMQLSDQRRSATAAAVPKASRKSAGFAPLALVAETWFRKGSPGVSRSPTRRSQHFRRSGASKESKLALPAPGTIRPSAEGPGKVADLKSDVKHPASKAIGMSDATNILPAGF